MRRLEGTAVAPGTARGRAFLYDPEAVVAAEDGGAPVAAAQRDRMGTAIAAVTHGLEADARQIGAVLGESSGAIFHAQAAMLNDGLVARDLERRLAEPGTTADAAAQTVFALLARRLRHSGSAMVRARADDLDDLLRRLLLALRGHQAHALERMPPGSVLVARQLFPSDAVFLSRAATVAVVAEFAGIAAHAALLARELGIPCVGGIPRVLEALRADDDLIVDGTAGLVVIDADAATAQRCSAIIAAEAARRLAPAAPPPAGAAADDDAVAVLGNARSREDVELAMRGGARGIGLFRTEPFFLASQHLPSPAEFVAFLDSSLAPARGRRVNVRLLDLGADKTPVYLPLPHEPDPFLGLRGIRVLRRFPGLLDAQLRALLDVGRRHDIGILIPMVVSESDVIAVTSRVRELAGELRLAAVPPVGAMIETPAAALTVPALRRHVDFFSIGSNDLTQYTMVAGRENPEVAGYFTDDHPAVLRLMELAIRDSGRTPIALCGELAGRVAAVPRLLALGLRALSVAASLVAEVRTAVQGARAAAF